MSFVQLLRSYILPGVFNSNKTKLIDCVIDEKSAGVDQFQSQVIFVSAVIQSGQEKKCIPLIVKFEVDNLKLRAQLKSGVQFFNEVLMYTKLLPFLNKQNVVEDTFPRCYYGICSSEEKKCLILEDLRPLGFRLTDERGYIDVAHLTIAMAKLGKFHALSYAAKKYTPEMFFSLARSLKERSWVEGTSMSRYNHIITASMHRAVDPLIKEGKHVKVLQSLLSRVKDNDSVIRFMNKLVAPEEPFAVICHGDFCRNNMLFSYNSEGSPADVKFFDVATARYSSPAMDIAFFLLLNGSGYVRRNHWDSLLSVYHRALSTAVPGLEVPSLEDIREEVRLKAVYGLVHCSHFLPYMLFQKEPVVEETVSSSDDKELAAAITNIGGEEGTNILSALVEDLVEMGCLVTINRYLI